MRQSPCVSHTASISIPVLPVPTAGRRPLWACICVLALAALAPGAALADGMALELSTEAVQSATTQINFTASTEALGFITVAVNNANVPCGSIPESDPGTALVEPALEAEGETGVYSGSVNFTPLETGPYIVCGWATGRGPGDNSTGGPALAAASLPIEVRPPHISLALSLADPITAGRPFTLNLMATSEVARELIVVGVPDTLAGCPANSASTTASPLIDTIITGGPQLKTASVKGLPAGSRWIFCAWAVVPGTVTPQASTSMLVDVPSAGPAPSQLSSPPKRRSKGHSKAVETRGCGTEKVTARITATISATGISCKRAHGVVHAVDNTPWPPDVKVPRYFTYSRPYGVNTPAGRFTCRFEPFGLAGTEHNIHCQRRHARVSWSTFYE